MFRCLSLLPLQDKAGQTIQGQIVQRHNSNKESKDKIAGVSWQDATVIDCSAGRHITAPILRPVFCDLLQDEEAAKKKTK